MLGKPPSREICDHVQRSGAFKEVRSVRNDFQPFHTAKTVAGCFVQGNYRRICAADDQQRRRVNALKRISGQIGTSTARYDGGNFQLGIRRRQERRGRSGARAEIADRQGRDARLFGGPASGGFETSDEKGNVETQMTGHRVRALFFAGEQIEQQGRESKTLQYSSHELISQAVTTASAAMNKEHEPERGIRNLENPFKLHVADGDLDLSPQRRR